MANHPLFATLNHFTTDLGIPSESESSRVGISLAGIAYDDKTLCVLAQANGTVNVAISSLALQ
jgi:hypothetical protein